VAVPAFACSRTFHVKQFSEERPPSSHVTTTTAGVDAALTARTIMGSDEEGTLAS
jgi:hypothetical protein